MPKELERKLMREAAEKGLGKGSEAWGRYVYGTMRKTGWKPKRERKKKQAGAFNH